MRFLVQYAHKNGIYCGGIVGGDVYILNLHNTKITAYIHFKALKYPICVLKFQKFTNVYYLRILSLYPIIIRKDLLKFYSKIIAKIL